MLKKIGYVFSLFCFLIIIGYCLMKLFSNPKPDSNTAEGLAEYGYVEGQVNEIRVGGVLLRFPAGVKYHPHTNVKFVKGEADDVEAGIFYPDLGDNNSLINGVPIHLFSRAGGEDPKVLDERIKQENWK